MSASCSSDGQISPEEHLLKDDMKDKRKESSDTKMIYGVEDVPPPHLTFLFGLQQAIMCIGGTLSVPFILTPLICAEGRDDVTSKLLSITMFMCGVATILQCLFGVRLPIIQGGSHTYIPPIVAMMTLEQFKCPVAVTTESLAGNSTGDPDDWMIRMREIQGNLILASLTQVLVGCFGLVGFILQFVGPLTIAPTVSLIGLSLIEVVSDFSEEQWGIAFLTMGIIIVCSVYINKVRIPFPVYSKEKSCHMARLQIFQLLPVFLAVCISWLLCLVLTETDTFPNNSSVPSYAARTDSRIDTLQDAPWFYFPTPFQFGVPTVSAAGYVGMLSATLSSIIESVGDYFASARLSHAPPPPPHALNRGIAFEGFSSIISGLIGAGHATTSYSNNIGCIGITKVASRVVFVTAGFILVICGVVGKVGAVLTLVPIPIIGGTLLIGLALVVSVGISVLKFCDMGSSRNITILGVSFLVGLMVPQWLAEHPGRVDTGSAEFDQVIRVLFGTASFTGGFIGFVLDNTVPGSKEERGIIGMNLDQGNDVDLKNKNALKTYELPFITKYLRRIKCCSYNPMSPTFDRDIEGICCKSNCCRRKSVTSKSYPIDEENIDKHQKNQQNTHL